MDDHLVLNLQRRVAQLKKAGFDFKRTKQQLPDILPPRVAELITLQDTVDANDLLKKVSMLMATLSKTSDATLLAMRSTTQDRPSTSKPAATRTASKIPDGYVCYICNQSGHWIARTRRRRSDMRIFGFGRSNCKRSFPNPFETTNGRRTERRQSLRVNRQIGSDHQYPIGRQTGHCLGGFRVDQVDHH